MKKFLETSELQKYDTYHIKNAYATHLDDMWWNNSVLVDIKYEWTNVPLYIFLLEDGRSVAIDGYLISKVSETTTGQKRYQIIGEPKSI